MIWLGIGNDQVNIPDDAQSGTECIQLVEPKGFGWYERVFIWRCIVVSVVLLLLSSAYCLSNCAYDRSSTGFLVCPFVHRLRHLACLTIRLSVGPFVHEPAGCPFVCTAPLFGSACLSTYPFICQPVCHLTAGPLVTHLFAPSPRLHWLSCTLVGFFCWYVCQFVRKSAGSFARLFVPPVSSLAGQFFHPLIHPLVCLPVCSSPACMFVYPYVCPPVWPTRFGLPIHLLAYPFRSPFLLLYPSVWACLCIDRLHLTCCYHWHWWCGGLLFYDHHARALLLVHFSIIRIFEIESSDEMSDGAWYNGLAGVVDLVPNWLLFFYNSRHLPWLHKGVSVEWYTLLVEEIVGYFLPVTRYCRIESKIKGCCTKLHPPIGVSHAQDVLLACVRFEVYW